MRARVLAELAELEQSRGIRVLLAVESGSRAWGMASPDSDHDVRFLYVHPRDWYVSVLESRDVLDAMLPGDLDLMGWELRKALRLMLRRNIELNEWLGSPIIYREVPGFRQALTALTQPLFSPAAALHHYRSMAAHALEGYENGGTIGLKNLFYVLRPLLACRWVRRERSQPPTALGALLSANLVSDTEGVWIHGLLRQKTAASEAATTELASSQARALHQELGQHATAVASLAPASPAASSEAHDQFLRHWVDAGRSCQKAPGAQ